MDLLQITMLENQLTNHKVKVEFTKVDGSNRVMICTKDPDIITEQNMPGNTTFNNLDAPPTAPSTILRVFDLEKNAWRSMRIANITAWELTQ